MTTSAVTETILLKGGLCVPLLALQTLWNLEERGFALAVEGDALVISPRCQLSAADERNIRTHQDALLALVQYCGEAVQ